METREFFTDALDAYQVWETGTPEPVVRGHAISDIFRAWQDNGDLLPNSVIDHLSLFGIEEDDLPEYTFGAVATLMLELIEDAST